MALSVRLDQWQDGPAPDGDSTGNNNEQFVNGNLNASKAHYAEGDSIPYRAVMDDLQMGHTYSIVIQWDTVDSGAYALDYLTSYNYSFEGLRHPGEPDVTPTVGVGDLSSSLISTVEIPEDTRLLTGFGAQYGVTDGLGSTQPSGEQFITIFGAVTGLSTGQIIYSPDGTKASIVVSFTYTGGNANNADSVVIAWGGHIASSLDWADDAGETVQTASDISGSPYHTRVLNLVDNGAFKSVGNQDRSLSANAVSGPIVTDTTVLADQDDSTGGIGDSATGDDDQSGLTGTISVTNVSSINFLDQHLDPVIDTLGAAVKSGGVALTYFWDGTGSTLYASTDATSLALAQASAVFTFHVAASSPFNYTFTLLKQVDHLSLNGQSGDDTENNLLIDLTYTAVGAGTTTGKVHVSLDDDMPTIGTPTAAAAIVLDESPVPPNGDGIVSATGAFSANFAAAVFGADGAGSVSYKLVLSAEGIGSALFALDPTDIETVNDPLGKGAEILLYVNNAGTVITGSTSADEAGIAAGNTYFTITVDNNPASPTFGDVTFAQTKNIWHDDVSNHDDPETLTTTLASGLQLVQTVTDFDGDSVQASINLGAGVFTIQDDGPTVTVNDATGDYAAGAQGTWTDLPGTDGYGSLGVTFDSYEIDTHGSVTTTPTNSTFTQTDDFAFEGSITDDFNGDGTDETVDFTLTFDPDLDSYDLQVTTPPSSTSTFDTSQGSLKAGGPDAVQTLLFGGTPPTEAGLDDIVFFGVVATAPIQGVNPAPPATNDLEDLVEEGATDLTEAQIEAKLPLAGLITPGTQMNVSTAGIGVNNNNLNGASEGAGTGAFAGTTITSGDESFVVNPETVVDSVTVFIDNSVGGYNPATEDLYYTVYYTDGTASGPTDVTAAMLHPVTSGVASGGKSFDIDGGAKQIDAVQLTMGEGTIKVPVIAFTVETVFAAEPLELDFTATLVDGDGDTHQDLFKIDLSSIL